MTAMNARPAYEMFSFNRMIYENSHFTNVLLLKGNSALDTEVMAAYHWVYYYSQLHAGSRAR